jgi:hypothetical protein
MLAQLMNDESENMRKETVVAYFKVISQNSTGVTEEIHGNPGLCPVEIRTGHLQS